MAEKYYNTSPYAQCLNNPVRYVDPDGRLVWFIPLIIKGVIGGVVDAAAQVTVSMANGQDFGEAMSNIDYTSVGASVVTSALTMPGMSTVAKVATVTAIAVDAAVDVSNSKGVESVVTGEKTMTNAAIDVAASVFPGKAVNGLTSNFNKAISSDLSSNAAATLTKETKASMKQTQTIVNGTAFQSTAKETANYTGKIIAGQAKTVVGSSTKGVPAPVTTPLVLPTDAIQTNKHIPLIFPQ
jgi:hypothetical protein